VHFDRRYANGAKAYENLIGSLNKGNFNPFGLTYVISVYADMKKALASFLESIGKSGIVNGLEAIAESYAKIAALYGRMTEIVPFTGHNPAPIEQKRIPDLVKLIEESSSIEAKVMNRLKEALDE
jgi:hypothetical protein